MRNSSAGEAVVITAETKLFDLGTAATFPDVRKHPPPHLRRVSQAVIQIATDSGTDKFRSIRAIILAWLQEKAGGDLPPAMLVGGPGKIVLPDSQQIEIVATGDVWAVRHADVDWTAEQSVWATEVGLVIADPETLHLGYKTECVTREDRMSAERSVPRFVRDIARSHSVRLDGVGTGLRARSVENAGDVEQLVALLLSNDRRHPVIGVGCSVSGESGIDADWLAQSLLGSAHVRAITPQAAIILAERIGAHLALSDRDVRLWNAPFQVGRVNPYRHPLNTGDRIDQWADAGSVSYARFLVNSILASSAAHHDADDLLRPFVHFQPVMPPIFDMDLDETQASDADDASLLEAEVQRLSCELAEQKAEYDELLEMAESDLRLCLAERDDACVAVAGLRARVAALELAVQKQKGEASTLIPDTLTELAEWGDAFLGDGVILLPRAISAAKKSGFQDVGFVYRVLLMIRNHYVPMRRSGDPSEKARWEQAMSELGLVLAPTFSGDRAGEHGETYIVSWQGHKHLLDMHFKSGSARDHRYCFRLYFFWDQDTKSVVVGSVPGHLATRST
jgi:hypothetical protein